MLVQGHKLRLLDEAGGRAEQHLGPENQDSQHRLDQPRGSSLNASALLSELLVCFNLWLLGFGRTDFSRIFIFGPPDFFADFLADFFSSLLWEKVPRKILQESPRKNPPNFIHQKSSDTFLQNGRGKICGC